MIDKNRAELLDRVRAALRCEGFEGQVVARGSGNVRGVPVEWTRVCDGSGRFVETVTGVLGHATGFDGTEGWRVDEMHMPGPLELGDLELLVVASAIWSGSWVRDGGPVIVEDVVATQASSLVLRVRAGCPREGARILHLTIDARTSLPRCLELPGQDDFSLSFDDFRPGGWGLVPHTTVLRQAWLTDTLRASSVERVPEAAAFGLPGRAPDDVTFDSEAAPVPWRRTRSQVPLVRPLIDGQDVGWFVLDTGAGALGIDARAAAELALPQLGHRVVRTADGVAGTPYRRARTLSVGGATLHAPLFLELDMETFGRAAGVKLAGVLGYDLFQRMSVTLAPGAAPVLEPAVADPERGSWVALRFQEGTPVIQARYPGADGPREGLFELDTGSAVAVTIAAWAAPGFATRGGARVALRGLTGAVGARKRSLPWFEMAGERLEDIDVLIAPSGPGAFGHAGSAIAGSLGMGLLRDFTITFDYRGRRARFLRKRRAPLRAPVG